MKTIVCVILRGSVLLTLLGTIALPLQAQNNPTKNAPVLVQSGSGTITCAGAGEIRTTSKIDLEGFKEGRLVIEIKLGKGKCDGGAFFTIGEKESTTSRDKLGKRQTANLSVAYPSGNLHFLFGRSTKLLLVGTGDNLSPAGSTNNFEFKVYVSDGKPLTINSPEKCLQNTKFKYLYPISPYQSTKVYHYNKAWMPKNSETPGDSYECKIKSPTNYCLATYIQHETDMSDLYVTDTNELVRAFWSVKYSERDETIGTLSSKGKSLLSDPNRNPQIYNAKQIVEGHTYRVPKDEFVCISAATEQEKATAQRELSKMETDQRFRKVKGYLYEPIR